MFLSGALKGLRIVQNSTLLNKISILYTFQSLLNFWCCIHHSNPLSLLKHLLVANQFFKKKLNGLL